MTQLGVRERVYFPHSYKGFHLLRTHGRVYAVPGFLDPFEVLNTGTLFFHRGVRTTATLAEMEALIDSLDPQSCAPQLIATWDRYNLFHYDGCFYGVPQAVGRIDLGLEHERRRPGVIRGFTPDEVQEGIAAIEGRLPIEFGGWLPIYQVSGNCGRHPQFKHTADPPAGYQFICSAPPTKSVGRWQNRLRALVKHVGVAVQTTISMIRPIFGLFRIGSGVAPRARLRVLGCMLRLLVKFLANGASPFAIMRFLQSRHFQSQLLLGKCQELVFLTSMPYTYGQNPWVIEIEDPTTLFYPMIQNGNTCDLRPADSPWFPIVKTLLESDECKGIITHMKSTARLVPTLFGSDKISNKVHYAPLGIKLPDRWQRHEEDEPEFIDLVFINSWCQVAANFYVRGGLDVLEAFATLHERYPQLRLTLRTTMPGLDSHYHQILETGWVRIIDRFMSAEEMSALLAGSHIFLLPAARIHVLSLLQAMSYGLAVVASDGWGIEEYLTHERNGLIVKGRYGKTSWADEQAGLLREDYDPMYTSDPAVVEGIIEAVSRLIEDATLRRRLGRTARQDVQTTYTLDGWNRGLKEVFDKILVPGDVAPRELQEPALTA